MIADWKAGDLALCVHGKRWHPLGHERAADQCSPVKSGLFPRVGTSWRVSLVLPCKLPEEPAVLIYLQLEGQPSDIAFDARFFVKLDEHSPDAEDAEVINLLEGARFERQAA